MNLHASHTPAHRSFGVMIPPSVPFGSEGVVLRHLKTPAEIDSVLDLREEIDLSVHASASSNFASLEKKETNWVLCSPSSRAAIL
ncbi:hypothetical protein [Ramlibacter sp. WS9]|uniref:hypothetical protein n=1 Tax=Ramlibacter sp. WS9 TaxID=1882741 RepID=UPI0011449CC3|nr:hypothetical protein [Ramlibacter sp. WS9]ROZ77494.1 hypothetical protein EEB15_08580 [Ramlibacter sp. WS9]